VVAHTDRIRRNAKRNPSWTPISDRRDGFASRDAALAMQS
jgi:hypothetical protein